MQVCVNPFFDKYEECQPMRLEKGAGCKVPRVGTTLDYGLFNFDLEDGASEPCIRRGKLPHVVQTLDRFEYRDFVKNEIFWVQT